MSMSIELRGLAVLIALVAARNAAFAQANVPPVPGPPASVTVPARAQPAPVPAQLGPLPPPGSAAPEPQVAPPSTGSVPLSIVQAVQITLRRHPALVTARSNLDFARGATLTARGPFDVTLGGALRHNHFVPPAFNEADQTRVDTTTLEASASTNLVWGTSLVASVGLTRIGTSRAIRSTAYQEALPQFAITQPLLRNAGRTGAASGVLAGEFAERAAEHTVAHVAQLQAFTVIDAYWSLVGADSELTLFRAAAARSQRMLQETQVLVDADQRPRGDLRALEAGYASRRRDLIEAERTRVRALHSLRLAMGLEITEAADWEPTDRFPVPGMPPMAPMQLAERALTVREDLHAAEASVRSAAAAERGADHNTLPRLDLTAAVGYTGATDRDGVGRYFDALGRNIGGVTASGGVNLEVPLDNSAARGISQQATAQRVLAETARADLARNLRTNVFAAYDDLRAEVQALEAAKEAEAAYAQALDDERSKLRAGLSTVLDTVLTEDLLTDATRSRIATELELARALARLRLELGTLPSSEIAAPQALAGVLDPGVIDDR
jgi:outer membrane protein TolC